MSEDEVENFEIIDYDLEFNIDRPRRKLSKKQQMLEHLNMMNKAISGSSNHQPDTSKHVSYLRNLERTQPTMSQMPSFSQPRMEVRMERNIYIERLAEVIRTTSQIPHGFKELVQKKCEERGILFMPISNKYKEAKQVYKVGENVHEIQVYFDGNVLFVCHNDSNWMPMHLNALLDKFDASNNRFDLR